METKEEINKRISDRLDHLAHEGKHGYYETIYKIVHEELAALTAERDGLAQQLAEMIQHRDELMEEIVLGWQPRLKEAEGLLWRYRNETPLGHQPHMIAGEVDTFLSTALEPK